MENHQRPTVRLVDALPDDGERRLMLAVLMDAMRIVASCRPVPPRRRGLRAWQRERDWFEADDCSRPFSFRSICDALGLNPGYVRRRTLWSPIARRTVRHRVTINASLKH